MKALGRRAHPAFFHIALHVHEARPKTTALLTHGPGSALRAPWSRATLNATETAIVRRRALSISLVVAGDRARCSSCDFVDVERGDDLVARWVGF